MYIARTSKQINIISYLALTNSVFNLSTPLWNFENHFISELLLKHLLGLSDPPNGFSKFYVM
jgi:hypothetical protein